MKKAVIAIALGIISVFLFACGGKTKAAQDAEEAINAIGSVTIDSEEAIAKAEKLVSLLTDAEKATLENRLVLVEAREEYERTIKEDNDNQLIHSIEVKIDALGTITKSSGSAIEEIEREISELSPEIVRRISNYHVLDEAKATFEDVCKDVEYYLNNADYFNAYVKADTDEMKYVKAENIAAVVSQTVVSYLKMPSSFVLHDVYYKDNYIVLQVGGQNGFGGTTINYWLFEWDSEEHKWDYYNSVRDLDDEEEKSYDDYEDKLEKLFNNLTRTFIRSTVKSGIELDKKAIERINQLFKDGKLDSVELLEVV